MKGIGDITAVANLQWSDSIVHGWIKDTRGPQAVVLPNLAILSPNARLRELGAWKANFADPKSLATVSSPSWCGTQQSKAPEEIFVCNSARLSAYDVVLAQFGGASRRYLSFSDAGWRAGKKGTGFSACASD